MNSHAELVDHIYTILVNNGIGVFWHVKDLPPGQLWEEAFANGSTNLILVSLCPCYQRLLLFLTRISSPKVN